VAVPAFAQPPGEARSFARTAAPFIDEHTLVVARVDVSRVEVDTVLKLAVTVLGAEEVGEMTPAVKAWVNEFVRLGGRDLFFTYGPADFPNLPCLVAPAPDNAEARSALGKHLLAAFQATGKDGEWIELHGCVCVGTREGLAVLKARKAVERSELAEAIDAGKAGVMQVAFALSADAKKIHEQIAPVLPAELGGGRVQTITRGMKWMALRVGPGPKMPATCITEAVSPAAAQDLRGIDVKAQQAALAQVLKGDGEADAAFQKRLAEITSSYRSSVDGARITSEWELATTLLQAVKAPPGPPAERMRSMNNMKQLLIALHNYHDAHGHFPVDSRDKDGKPLLSWRVQILPYVEEDNLYRQFKLNEPWDSEHNKKLIDKMPKLFRSPRQADNLKDQTTYLAPLGKGLMWDQPAGLKITNITDGTSNTIALVEADDERAVTWTKPQDITIDPKNPLAGLLGHYTEGFHAAMADGSVKFIKKTTHPEVLWSLFTRAGGEIVDPSK
jgi:hypothetical protein